MGRADAARRPARGGEIVPSPADIGARLIRALPALAALGTVAAYPPVAADRAGGPIAAAAVAAAIALAVALVWRSGALVQVALVLVGLEFAALLYDGGSGILATALFAGGLLLAAELAFWAVEPPAPRGPAVVARRSAAVAASAAGGAALAWFLIAVTDVSLRGSLVLEAIGVGAAVTALALVVRLARGAAGAA